MNDMTMATPRPVRRIRPKPLHFLVQPDWRVEAPAPEPAQADMVALARAVAAKAARKAAAFQPVETILISPDFRARVEALAARRGGTLLSARPVTTARPMAAG